MGEQLVNIIGFAGFLTIVILAVVLALKMENIKKMRMLVNKLKHSLDEMDEQAKLIVHTDMELNRTQEELDKKIAGLFALQKLSRNISTSLEETQIFKMFESSSLKEIGFEKCCAFIWSQQLREFLVQINIGYLDNEILAIKDGLNLEKNAYTELIRTAKTISSISKQTTIAQIEKVNRLFNVKHFIISPILPKEGNQGLFFVGTNEPDTIINEGDEELITILSNQLGQALENARLFEKTFAAQHELEHKVEERTQALSEALKEVQEINKRKTDFVSSVSHELRTPLTAIKGYAAILISGSLGQVPDAAHQRLEKINQRSDELVRFINELLDIARIESGKTVMKQEPHDLNKIIEVVADTMAVLLKEKQIEFSVNVEQGLNVLVDVEQIKRVFINLVNNALKYTPAKGKITVNAKKLDKEIQVDIIDTGCGMPEDSLGKLFQEFYRVDSEVNQQVKGTGLGLTLTKNIIEAHKGKIWVKSKLGTGSTFSFTLPLA